MGLAQDSRNVHTETVLVLVRDDRADALDDLSNVHVADGDHAPLEQLGMCPRQRNEEVAIVRTSHVERQPGNLAPPRGTLVCASSSNAITPARRTTTAASDRSGMSAKSWSRARS